MHSPSHFTVLCDMKPKNWKMDCVLTALGIIIIGLLLYATMFHGSIGTHRICLNKLCNASKTDKTEAVYDVSNEKYISMTGNSSDKSRSHNLTTGEENKINITEDNKETTSDYSLSKIIEFNDDDNLLTDESGILRSKKTMGFNDIIYFDENPSANLMSLSLTIEVEYKTNINTDNQQTLKDILLNNITEFDIDNDLSLDASESSTTKKTTNANDEGNDGISSMNGNSSGKLSSLSIKTEEEDKTNITRDNKETTEDVSQYKINESNMLGELSLGTLATEKTTDANTTANTDVFHINANLSENQITLNSIIEEGANTNIIEDNKKTTEDVVLENITGYNWFFNDSRSSTTKKTADANGDANTETNLRSGHSSKMLTALGVTIGKKDETNSTKTFKETIGKSLLDTIVEDIVYKEIDTSMENESVEVPEMEWEDFVIRTDLDYASEVIRNIQFTAEVCEKVCRDRKKSLTLCLMSLNCPCNVVTNYPGKKFMCQTLAKYSPLIRFSEFSDSCHCMDLF